MFVPAGTVSRSGSLQHACFQQDVARTTGTATGHVIRGVQFNLFGQREAYWLYNYHPGGVYMLNPRGGILRLCLPAR